MGALYSFAYPMEGLHTVSFMQRDPRSSVETTPLMLARNRTANGGWEWWIAVGGERIGEVGGVGIFTDQFAQIEDVLPRLLARMAPAS